MSTLIAHASIDERGKVAGGKSGDQTEKEVCIRSWYSKPWDYVIRFKDPIARIKVAECMRSAAINPVIGYDQTQRNTLLAYARNVGYNPGKVTVPCETDCSALVSLACIYAGIPERTMVVGGNSATTRTLKGILESTGKVEIFSDKSYTTKDKNLMAGDILLSEGHHVAAVVQTDGELNHKKDILSVAKDVIHGKYGSGPSRRQKLEAEGYDYNEVQSEVNRILKGG